jgi:hypothetical protein
MTNPIFPTFDEIKEGYCVYERQGPYKGEDDYGTPIFGRRLSKKVSIQHGWYDKYITIDIILSPRTYAPIGFKFGYDGKWFTYKYEYSEKGYEEMLKKIKEILQYDVKLINQLIEGLERKEG